MEVLLRTLQLSTQSLKKAEKETRPIIRKMLMALAKMSKATSMVMVIRATRTLMTTTRTLWVTRLTRLQPEVTFKKVILMEKSAHEVKREVVGI